MASPTTPTRAHGSRSEFTPTRPAPAPPSSSPPTYSSLSTSPFSTYVPHHHMHRAQPSSYSSTSLDSASTLYSPTSPSRSHTHAHGHAERSPLNTPLTRPRPRPLTQNRSISYPSPSSGSSASNYASSHGQIRLPAELSLFDHRPRQSLLADIECIIGRKLHFPLLSPSRSKNKNKSQRKEKESVSGQKLRKERVISDDDVFWSGVMREEVVVIGQKKGRGVREGNWI